ncbi:Inner membrane protein YrbG, putative calcium/sodium:proton antiporter [Enhygromyxa salina]|uniref:Inner membrane protein YrbG, putative calcium/sodium:proton antiporter n=1 Tax=Enhygromyxa salina TaxID=215803 RepID=A0A0C1ZE12_9BACT|nr:calcium/sodium antiporter [Enhygromyxa salina]KIG15894.1 Inner membrane protein YrbG, putative calcium/sodium:proton antiporter [Enhygromyxa salina]
MDLVLAGVVVVVGLAGLVLGADRFVFGASSLARRLGVSPLLVGMVIVGFGTSAPEMLVSAVASIEGSGGIALGNVVGSNITNIALVLGVSALIKPITLHRDIVRRELPVVIGITALGALLLIDGELTARDGGVLIVLLILFLLRSVRSSREAAETEDEDKPPVVGYGRASLWLGIGLALLMASSQGVVWGASKIATWLGVSDLIIGLTIVAIGTSLPELAATAAAAFRGEHEMAIGNVLGSNVFNLLAVLPFPALLDPGALEPGLLERDYAVMGGLTLLLLVFSIGYGKQGRINRIEGGVLVLAYAGYLTMLVLSAMGQV